MNHSSTPSAAHRHILLLGYGLVLSTSVLALFAWLDMNDFSFADLSLYRLFPLLGLLAFSVMWSQYVTEAIKNYSGHPTAGRSFFTSTSLIVLILILLHPGILIAERFKDGYGLPPQSYLSYVAPTQKWLVLLGSVSLLMFLAFEFKRFFGNKPWWKYIILLNDAAILAIFYHGLRLGQDLHDSWYQIIWYFYGVTLVWALIYKYFWRHSTKSQPSA